MFLPISCSILIAAMVLFSHWLLLSLTDSMFGIYHWIVIVFSARLSVALQAHYGVVTIPLSFSIQSENAIFVRIAISLPRSWWFLFRCVCSLLHALISLFFILTMAINKWNVSLFLSLCVYTQNAYYYFYIHFNRVHIFNFAGYTNIRSTVECLSFISFHFHSTLSSIYIVCIVQASVLIALKSRFNSTSLALIKNSIKHISVIVVAVVTFFFTVWFSVV